jgi:tRNA splicing ligase
MPEVIITYKKPETLKVLKILAKYLDFEISSHKAKKETKPYKIRGVTIIPATEKFDQSDITDIFTDNNSDAAKLKKEA